MSLPWIKIASSLPDHPKSDLLEAATGIPRAWSHVVELWLWVSRVQADGDLSKLPAATIARRSGVSTDPDAWVQALKDCGFLDADGIVHDWWEYQGEHMRKRERDKARAAEKRKQAKTGLQKSLHNPKPGRTGPVDGLHNVERESLHIQKHALQHANGSDEKDRLNQQLMFASQLSRGDVAATSRGRGDERRGEEKERGFYVEGGYGGENPATEDPNPASLRESKNKAQNVVQLEPTIGRGKNGDSGLFDALLDAQIDGGVARDVWRQKFPAFDGVGDRPTYETALQALRTDWLNCTKRQRWKDPAQVEMALAGRHKVHLIDYRRDLAANATAPPSSRKTLSDDELHRRQLQRIEQHQKQKLAGGSDERTHLVS